MSDEARDLFFAEKQLSGSLQWIDDGRNSLILICPLEAKGITLEGLRLRCTVLKDLPDEELCVQIEHFGDRSKFEPIGRVEWKPIAPHSNRGKGPPELLWKPFRKTHIHPFEENLAERLRSPRSRNLPIAIPVSQEPPIFEAALELAGKEFRISDMGRVPRPPWQARLF